MRTDSCMCVDMLYVDMWNYMRSTTRKPCYTNPALSTWKPEVQSEARRKRHN